MSRARQRTAAAVPRSDLTRPEGWYMQPVYRASAMHPIGWPPRFEPQYQQTGEVDRSAIARDSRELRMQRGETGTIADLSEASNARHRPALARLLTGVR